MAQLRTIIKEEIDDMNVRAIMYKNIDNKKYPYSVIVRDMDVDEIVSHVLCPNIELAERNYLEATVLN